MKRWMQGMLAVAMLACLLAPATVAEAQEAPKPAEEEKKTEAKTDDERVAVEFTFEGLIFVQTKVNGKGPYKFLFDSGATQSVINDRLADELGVEKHDMPGGGGVQGVGTAEAKMVVLDDIEINDYSRGKCVAASMNLDHMSGALGYHMMGIIGQNIIKMIKEIEIDFSTSTMYFEEYGEGEMPRDQDEMIIRMLEGGGMGGIPGIPGLPGPDDDNPGDDGEDDFSINPMPQGQWYAQGGDAGKIALMQDDRKTESTESRPNADPANGQQLTYTTVSLPMIGELVPYWYLDCEINGEQKTMMFDTGASMLLALGEEMETDLGLTTGFGYPVKGIGKGEAMSAMIDSFSVGNLEVEEVPATIMALPKMSDQLPEMMKMIIPMLKQQGIAIDFDGIVGITLATRYKKMTVNTQDKTIDFEPYAEGEVNKLAPYEGEEFVKEGVIRTWHGQAGKFGLTGDAVELDDWEGLGLESGGLRVEEVEKDGAAAIAGIKKGDIITHLVGMADKIEGDALEDAAEADGDVVVRDMPALIMIACNEDPGTDITVRLKRGDEEIEVVLKLDKYGWEGTIPEKYKRD